MIDAQTVDKIVEAAKIVDVVSDYVSLRRRGANYTGLCPFHNERTPSFSVSPAKGICKCFSCGKGGNALHFIMEVEQLTYFEALKFLAKKYQIDIKEREETDSERAARTVRESLFLVNDFAQNLFVENLFNSTEGQNIGLSYFRERGFREDIIRKFKLGYAIDQKDHYTQLALQKGFKLDFLGKTGLTVVGDNNYVADRFRGRVIFPVHTISGKVVAFGGRILKKKENVGKYVNSPESEIYSKRRELYGLYQSKSAIVKQDHCFMVEGYTDVISMHQAGIENVVASSGTALTEEQIRKIRQYTYNMTVLYDGDPAGIKASLRGIDLLLKEGMHIKVVLLPEGEDPDSFSLSRSSTEFNEFIKEKEVDFIRFKTNLMLNEAANDPIKKAELVNDVVESIACIPDAIYRSVYIKDCSDLLQMPEAVVMDAVNKTIVTLQNKSERRPIIETPFSAASSSGQDSGNPQSSFPPPSPEDLPPFLSNMYEAEDSSFAQSGYNSTIPSPPSPGDSQNVALPIDAYLTAIPRPNMSKRMRCEVALVRYIVRYGDNVMFMTEDEQGGEIPISVIEYLTARISEEQLTFSHPLYTRIYEEAVAHFTSEGFQSCRYFTYHPDVQISKLSAELSFDKYQLSKVHAKFQKVETEEERLYSLIIRAITEFMDAVVDEEIVLLKRQLKEEMSVERMSQILLQLQDLIQKKSILGKHIGDRVINN